MSDRSPNSEPSLKARVKPLEIVVLSAIVSVFAGVVVMLGTRAWVTALIAFGIAFIAVLVVFATLALTVKPDDDEIAEIAAEHAQLQQQREAAAQAGEAAAPEHPADEGPLPGAHS
ncbi:hypothetical protein [Pseudoclavibacter soli]|uniref:hypothetical protein n=1 Tax=Pseudoclavibacter soli TaxID=452623 RepID=UPI000408F796|nr:hypothetical protein [Pseudoclavibacter soli]